MRRLQACGGAWLQPASNGRIGRKVLAVTPVGAIAHRWREAAAPRARMRVPTLRHGRRPRGLPSSPARPAPALAAAQREYAASGVSALGCKRRIAPRDALRAQRLRCNPAACIFRAVPHPLQLTHPHGRRRAPGILSPSSPLFKKIRERIIGVMLVGHQHFAQF